MIAIVENGPRLLDDRLEDQDHAARAGGLPVGLSGNVCSMFVVSCVFDHVMFVCHVSVHCVASRC